MNPCTDPSRPCPARADGECMYSTMPEICRDAPPQPVLDRLWAMIDAMVTDGWVFPMQGPTHGMDHALYDVVNAAWEAWKEQHK